MALLAITAGALAFFFAIDTVMDVQRYRLEEAIDRTRDVRWQNILDVIDSHHRDLEIDAAIKRHPSGWEDKA